MGWIDWILISEKIVAIGWLSCLENDETIKHIPVGVLGWLLLNQWFQRHLLVYRKGTWSFQTIFLTNALKDNEQSPYYDNEVGLRY